MVAKDRRELGEADKESVKWEAVPLGGPSHMGKGPWYTGGEEHYGHYVHCSAGNCEPLEKAGVNVDSWKGVGLPRTVPLPMWDPSMDYKTRRAKNQRKGPWEKYNTGTNPGAWGGAYDPMHDPSDKRLERHGVNVRSRGYKAIPLPAFDQSAYDDDEGKSVVELRRSAKDVLQSERDHDRILGDKGVAVNSFPAAKPGVYSHADGISDRLVHVVGVPKYRNKGAAEYEQPSSFLLWDDNHLGEKQLGTTEEGYEKVKDGDADNESALSKAGVNVASWPDRLGQLLDLD